MKIKIQYSILILLVFIAGNCKSSNIADNHKKQNDENAKIVSVNATTTLQSPSGKYNYDPENLIDKSLSKSWCEGAADNGEGTKITLYVNSITPVYQLFIANSLGNPQYWKANNRIKGLKIHRL